MLFLRSRMVFDYKKKTQDFSHASCMQIMCLPCACHRLYQ